MKRRAGKTSRRFPRPVWVVALACVVASLCVAILLRESSFSQKDPLTDETARQTAEPIRRGAPVARPDHAETIEGMVVDIRVLDNDRAAAGDALRVVGVTRPSSGWVLVNGDETLRYQPDTGFVGLDDFAYTIEDDRGGAHSATVTVRVHDAPDPPEARNQSIRADEDTEIAITLAGTDADGDALAFRIERLPAHGSLSGTLPEVSYTPDADFHGTDSFVYAVDDGHGGVDTARVSIQIDPMPDLPLALDDEAVTVEGMVVDIHVLGNDRDPDGQEVRIVAVTRPANGWVLVNGDDTLRYQPITGFTGRDDFSYTIADVDGSTHSATVSVSVRPER